MGGLALRLTRLTVRARPRKDRPVHDEVRAERERPEDRGNDQRQPQPAEPQMPAMVAGPVALEPDPPVEPDPEVVEMG